MTYEDAIAWWYSRIDYERRVPVPGDLKLDQIRALLGRQQELEFARGIR